jgi:hypothetical protein
MPNLFVVGAAKAGTTALYEYLRQHPQVHMSRWKEPKYFAFRDASELGFRGPDGPAPVNDTAVLDRDVYEGLWGDTDAPVRGEASAIYLYVEQAAERIATEVDDARVVAILRNPVERAFSSYAHLRREALEPLDFAAALDAEPQRIAERYGFLWRYADLGFYTGQLARYQRRFDPDRLLVLLHDDLVADPTATLGRLWRFLDVDAAVTVDLDRRPNASGAPRSRLVHRLLNPPPTVKRALWDRTPGWLAERLLAVQTRVTARNLEPLTLAAADRARLVEVFRDEVTALQDVVGRDLGHWLAQR